MAEQTIDEFPCKPQSSQHELVVLLRTIYPASSIYRDKTIVLRSGYAPEFRGRFFRYSAMPPVHDHDLSRQIEPS